MNKNILGSEDINIEKIKQIIEREALYRFLKPTTSIL